MKLGKRYRAGDERALYIYKKADPMSPEFREIGDYI
jgi:hypothetical protein